MPRGIFFPHLLDIAAALLAQLKRFRTGISASHGYLAWLVLF